MGGRGAETRRDERDRQIEEAFKGIKLHKLKIVRGLSAVGEKESEEDAEGTEKERVDEVIGRREVSIYDRLLSSKLRHYLEELRTEKGMENVIVMRLNR